jgi:restriction system protein
MMTEPGRTWVVRAGKDAVYIDDFRGNSVVALGWAEVGPVGSDMSDEALTALFDRTFPGSKPAARRVWQAQVRRFVTEVRVGDRVATYDPNLRVYLLGTITGALTWRPGPMPRAIAVQWSHQAARDSLTADTRNGLGSIASFFRASEETSAELWAKATPLSDAPAPPLPPPLDGEENDTETLREDVLERADRFIEDRIAALDWRQMQDLVAGLRGMGYKTTVSADGPDRGVDIFASPDGLGLQEPRIFVEVKHRGGAMGADQVRRFLGGRRSGDRCLYVSTGGFTKEARFEAERSNVPLTLVTLPMLRDLLVQHYERLDSETRTLVPLQRLYWPLS